MKNLAEFKKTPRSKIEYIFTDIDDTLTDDGSLQAEPYAALWRLRENGMKIIPVTGRPAGWCEMIARFWPVEGVIGENGGFYFRYHEKKMKREFAFDEAQRELNRNKLNQLQKQILQKVKGAQVASDQFCRLMDLAIDYCEDVTPTLSDKDIQEIVDLFHKAEAQAKVSSIHINGWFGQYDKLTMCHRFMSKEFNFDLNSNNDRCIFVGDSPNDEPMFQFFKNSFAVANIKRFLPDLKSPPQYVANHAGGQGFVEIADCMIRAFPLFG